MEECSNEKEKEKQHTKYTVEHILKL